jgi:8-amino-7-oxononanoate synthase
MKDMMKKRLGVQEKAGLTRHLRPVRRRPLARIEIDNQSLVNFSSNDYLSLSFHNDIKKAFCDGITQYGVGAGGASVVCGFDEEKMRLQNRFADFVGTEKSLFFSSGYTANLSVITALCEKETDIFIDKFSHASIYDALALKGLSFQRYHHIDMAHLGSLLKRSTAKSKLIISEGVFSMTGSRAPIAELVGLKKEYNATLFIDDAHAIGVLGASGNGSLAGRQRDEIDIIVCPLSKAFASTGALVCGSDMMIEGLIQFSRPFLYSTSLPASHAVGLQTTLSVVEKANVAREKLSSHIDYFLKEQKNLPFQFLPSSTAIQLLYLGDNQKALALSETLKQAGFFCYPMRAPTIPKRYTGLRIVLTAGHNQEDIQGLCQALSNAYDKLC